MSPMMCVQRDEEGKLRPTEIGRKKLKQMGGKVFSKYVHVPRAQRRSGLTGAGAGRPKSLATAWC